jgi:ATP-dependent DNA helicase RecQ
MAESAQQILERIFGYRRFRGHQRAIIDRLAAGGDALALMPTGGGKSLCYQIPALLRPGAGIVVSPLIALMADQVDALRQLGVRAAFLNSTLEPAEQSGIERQLLDGELDLLYLAPERLLREGTLALLGRAQLALFAIDEAHCVSQWGHDFRPEYQQLSLLAERFPGIPRIALTATADRRTREEIVEQLALQRASRFISSFDRPNIRYTIDSGSNGRERLWRFLQQEHPDDAGIVYCLSRRKVEETAEWLSAQGRPALPYHAGLDPATRQQHQQRFLREPGLIIVATIAFGMGIDKPDVRFVAHLNLPKSIEAYYQETGRAGRDGAPADAWMNYGLQDVITLRQFINQTDAADRFKRVSGEKLERMLGLCDLTACRRQALLAYFDETLETACGNCDNCLSPPETWDASDASRKALSCAYRTGQRFGANYLVDVLTGKEDERIRQNGHDRLSTFGIGDELNASQWRQLIRQLLSRGYLETDVDGHGSLRLSEQCRPLLKGEERLLLRKQRKQSREKRTRKVHQSGLSTGQQRLFEALRELRREIALQLNLPPYVIFHDATLIAMSQQQPMTLSQMASISGVGEHKLERYGQQFLDRILAHLDPSTPSEL